MDEQLLPVIELISGNTNLATSHKNRHLIFVFSFANVSVVDTGLQWPGRHHIACLVVLFAFFLLSLCVFLSFLLLGKYNIPARFTHIVGQFNHCSI